MGYRLKTNAVILLDIGYTLRGEHTWEKWRKESKQNFYEVGMLNVEMQIK
jgi:hypothetical protein